MFNARHTPENRSRSPPHYQPSDPLQNDERPLPLGWTRRISNNVDPYYTNGQQSQWNFPNQEQNLTEALIQRVEAEYQVRIERVQAEERRARIQRAEAEERQREEAEERRALIQAEERQSLREKLALITNDDFNDYNIETFLSLRRMIVVDNEQPINRLNLIVYILDLRSLIAILKDPYIHSVLKRLCENIFEEMYEKLAKEKELIDFGFTRHNERDTAYIIWQLNEFESIYTEFRNIINNIP